MTPQRFFFVLLITCLLAPLLSPAEADARSSDSSASLIDLGGKNLRGLDLRGWDLRWADLDGADLRDADLSGARLTGARLRGARLDGASLRGADLRLADLTGVSLRGTDLRDADLSAAQIAPTSADAARWSGAICPNDQLADGACQTTVPVHDSCATSDGGSARVEHPRATSAPGRRAAF